MSIKVVVRTKESTKIEQVREDATVSSFVHYLLQLAIVDKVDEVLIYCSECECVITPRSVMQIDNIEEKIIEQARLEATLSEPQGNA